MSKERNPLEISDFTRAFKDRARGSRLRVEVPEIGAALFFPCLTTRERDRYLGSGKDDGSKALDLIVAKAETEDGEKVFTKADRMELERCLPWKIVDRIFFEVFEYVPEELDPNG